MLLAGVDALTLPEPLLRGLLATTETETKAADRSLFGRASNTEEQETERKSFVENETRFRKEFAQSYSGKGLRKTTEVPRTLPRFCTVGTFVPWLT